MVQIIPAAQRKPSFAERLNQSFAAAADTAGQYQAQQKQQAALAAENEAAKKLGIDLAGFQDPNLRKEVVSQQLQGGRKAQDNQGKMLRNQAIIADIEQRRGLAPGSLASYEDDPAMAERITKPEKEKNPTLTEKPVPAATSKAIKKILVDHPTASADELRSYMDEAGIPPVYSNPYTENRRRTEEQVTKTKEEQRRALRQETLPIRTKLAEKAMTARKGIQNKEQMMSLIETGNLNDPTFAALAESLPLNLGKRMLSPETVEYKAGLVEEFGDLRNIFQGQTRMKEIELLEAKVADIYLTDEQKKTILKSRINALKADIIFAEAASELENRDDLGVLQFNSELEKKAKPRMEALFNNILDEQKAVIDAAERRKNSKLPLDPDDPDDNQILIQILKEADGDKMEARKIAKAKGYSF